MHAVATSHAAFSVTAAIGAIEFVILPQMVVLQGRPVEPFESIFDLPVSENSQAVMLSGESRPVVAGEGARPQRLSQLVRLGLLGQ